MLACELIDKLKMYDGGLHVCVYVAMGEDMDDAHGVCIQDWSRRDEEDHLLYCKGDHPLDPEYGWVKQAKVVCIK